MLCKYIFLLKKGVYGYIRNTFEIFQQLIRILLKL